MTAPFLRALRTAISWLPSLAPARAARDLVIRANAARDARRYQAAAALYAEASRLNPANARIHKQCGHMHKEAGDFQAAERHYLQAFALDPADADLQLQLGHFYKISSRVEEAEAAYATALTLQPGWKEAADELALVNSGRGAGSGQDQEIDLDGLAPELLPGSGASPMPSWRETVQIRRLGAARVRTSGGYRRVLRGIEAIRGFAISSIPLLDVTILLEGEAIATEDLQVSPLDAEHAKYVFNVWHDFTPYAPGEYMIELRLRDVRGVNRCHRAMMLIQLPIEEVDAPSSDTIVVAGIGDGSLEDRVNARPSVARSARRGLLGSTPRAILVQRVDQLGDLVVSVPAIRRLREHFPEARIVALVSLANAELASSLSLFDDVITVELSETPGETRRTMTPAAQSALRNRLSAFRFDVAVDLSEAGDARPLLLLSGARMLFGFKHREFPWLTVGFDLSGHDPANQLEIISPATKLVAMVNALKSIVDPPATALPKSFDAARAFEALGIDGASRYAVLHQGARLAYSRWPWFEDLARILAARTDLQIVLLGDDPISPDLAEHPRVRSIAGMIEFTTFEAMLANACVFVGNDSGPKHLAGLRGTPVVSLHMARLNWNEWGQEPGGTIMSRRVPCAGCAIGQEGEECGKDFACLVHIRPEEVAAEVMKLIA